MPPWLFHVRPPSAERSTSMWLSEEPSDFPTCWAAINVPSASGVITGMNAPCLALREMMPVATISIGGAIPAWYPAMNLPSCRRYPAASKASGLTDSGAPATLRDSPPSEGKTSPKEFGR